MQSDVIFSKWSSLIFLEIRIQGGNDLSINSLHFSWNWPCYCAFCAESLHKHFATTKHTMAQLWKAQMEQ